MAKIYNSDVTKNLQKNAGIQQNKDKTPDELAEKIVPVIETNPALLRIINKSYSSNTTTSGGVTIATIPTGKRFYIYSAQINYIKDAASDTTTADLYVTTAKNGRIDILGIGGITLTAQQGTEVVSFAVPIVCEAGDTIGRYFVRTAGVNSYYFVINGYLEDIKDN